MQTKEICVVIAHMLADRTDILHNIMLRSTTQGSVTTVTERAATPPALAMLRSALIRAPGEETVVTARKSHSQEIEPLVIFP